MNKRHQNLIVIAGGSGFIGTAIAKACIDRGYRVSILSRQKQSSSSEPTVHQPHHVVWDGHTLGPWVNELEDARALINLTGKTINCRHTQKNRSEILSSRLDSIAALQAAIAICSTPPRVWIQASAVGIYGHHEDSNPVTEDTPPALRDFLSNVCEQWEDSYHEALLRLTHPIRHVLLRIAPVLGQEGGPLPSLIQLARVYLGGQIGRGTHGMSWIHIDDLVAIVLHAIESDECSGTYNASAPNPVSNAVFMKTLRQALKRPWSPPAPEIAVRLGTWLLGIPAELALHGAFVYPERLIKSGFRFLYPTLSQAIRHLI